MNEAYAALQTSTNDLAKLTNLRDRLLVGYQELRKINGKFVPLIPAKDMEAEYAAIADHDYQVISMLSGQNFLIGHLERSSYVVSATTPQLQPVISTSVFSVSLPRLPKLKIMLFNGDLHRWMAFWEQLGWTIHKNVIISVSNKFQCCYKYLIGNAAATVAGLATTEMCYANVILALQQRFGNKQTSSSHGPAIPVRVKPANSVQALWRLYDTMQLNIRCLAVLGVSTSSFPSTLWNLYIKRFLLAFRRLQWEEEPCLQSAQILCLDLGGEEKNSDALQRFFHLLQHKTNVCKGG